MERPVSPDLALGARPPSGWADCWPAGRRRTVCPAGRVVVSPPRTCLVHVRLPDV